MRSSNQCHNRSYVFRKISLRLSSLLLKGLTNQHPEIVILLHMHVFISIAKHVYVLLVGEHD